MPGQIHTRHNSPGSKDAQTQMQTQTEIQTPIQTQTQAKIHIHVLCSSLLLKVCNSNENGKKLEEFHEIQMLLGGKEAFGYLKRREYILFCSNNLYLP